MVFSSVGRCDLLGEGREYVLTCQEGGERDLVKGLHEVIPPLISHSVCISQCIVGAIRVFCCQICLGCVRR